MSFRILSFVTIFPDSLLYKKKKRRKERKKKKKYVELSTIFRFRELSGRKSFLSGNKDNKKIRQARAYFY